MDAATAFRVALEKREPPRRPKIVPAVHSRRILLLALRASVMRASHAQQRPHTIGFLVPGSDEFARKEYDAVTRELRSLGYSKDRLTIILRADSNQSRLSVLANELVRLKVSFIITVGTNASIAARGATSTIPILFYGVADPLGSGLADSLARPGRNSTGLTNFSGRLLTEKRVALLRQLLPNLTRVAYLWDPVTGDRGIGPLINEMGIALGFSTLVVSASSPPELERAFQDIVDFRSQAVIFQVDTFFEEVRRDIAEILIRIRLPSVFGDRVHVEAGGLMSYGANEDNNAGQVAIYADKILRGDRADDIPIQQPTSLEFVISRKTAEILGLKIPPALLLQAARVIE